MDAIIYLLEGLLLPLHFFCLESYAFLLLLQFLNILDNAAIQFLSSCGLELLVGLVFVHVYYFLFNFVLLLGGLGIFSFFFELIFGNVDKIGDVTSGLGILHCLSRAKAETLFLLSHFICRALLLCSIVLLLLLLSFLLWKAVVGDVSDCCLVDITELHE